MSPYRSANGSIHIHEVPEGSEPVTVDDVASTLGTLPIAIHMRLPDARLVAVPIRPEGQSRKPAPDQPQ